MWELVIHYLDCSRLSSCIRCCTYLGWTCFRHKSNSAGAACTFKISRSEHHIHCRPSLRGKCHIPVEDTCSTTGLFLLHDTCTVAAQALLLQCQTKVIVLHTAVGNTWGCSGKAELTFSDGRSRNQDLTLHTELKGFRTMGQHSIVGDSCHRSYTWTWMNLCNLILCPRKEKLQDRLDTRSSCGCSW